METSWACDVSGIPTEGLTVGTKFELKCSGPEVSQFNTKSLSLELGKPDKFRLRILENRKSSTNGVELVVTGYVPGQNSLKDVVLTDGVNRIPLTGLDFSVNSVIQEGEKDPKPFPAEAPLSLMWPTSVFVSLVLFVAVVIMALVATVQRRRRRAKFLLWLEAHRTPMSPFDQLNKELRKLLKERNALKHLQELELATQIYLSCQFRVPLQTRSTRQILKAIVGRDKRARALLTPITVRLFGEFERVSESLEKSQLDQTEALNIVLPQIHELIREFAEKVQLEVTSRGKKS